MELLDAMERDGRRRMRNFADHVLDDRITCQRDVDAALADHLVGIPIPLRMCCRGCLRWDPKERVFDVSGL